LLGSYLVKLRRIRVVIDGNAVACRVDGKKSNCFSQYFKMQLFVSVNLLHQCTSVHILLRARMRAQIQGRVSGCASVHLFHNNILVKSRVVIDKSKRVRKAVIYHLDVCSLLSLLVILYSRTRTGVLNERRHIGSVGLLRAGYHCY